ncbi:MAG: GNAT family N-acetyltransferase [Ktedonobacteraceae bacterium]|nr:GNAT family N-acetyltransferase [Ktedonobacteraceae bacterium]
MVVRLHNLSARPPVLGDLKAVTKLMVACERADVGVANISEEEMENNWQASGFTLRTDAWVIVTNRGQVVGYADVRQSGEHEFTSLLRVHPGYLGRGIGTLLVWLTEERARQLMYTLPLEQRVTLVNVVSSRNVPAQHLLEREGYMPVHQYWSLLTRAEEDVDVPHYHRKHLTADLVIDVHNVPATQYQVARTGIYTVHQYHVFEKELRTGETLPILHIPETQCVSV